MYFRLLLPLLLVMLLAGCSASAPTATRLEGRTPAASPPPPASPTPPASPAALAEAARALYTPEGPPPSFARAVRRGTRSRDGRPGPSYWQQDARYTMTARLIPDSNRLEGTGRILYTNNAPDTLHLLYLELAQNLHAPEVMRNTSSEVTGGVRLHRLAVGGRTLATDASPGYLVQGTRLLLRPHDPVPPGTSAEIEVEWSFMIPQAGASGRMGHSQGNLFFLAYWYPQMAVYDDVYGWLADPFRGQAEFYADFADYDVTVEAPAGWLVAATGTLKNPDAALAPEVADRMRRAHQSDTPIQVVGPEDFDAATASSGDGPLRWHFTAENVRDFAFSATRASIWEAARTPVGDRDGDGQTDYTAINTFYRETAPRWKEVTRYQQHSLTYQSRYTGFPYPWPHMTAVEGGGIIGGGMEFPMMTLMGDYNASDDRSLYYVTAHELAHMWIPMIAGSNERRYSWIDEGATTYLENQSRADFFPGPDHEAPDRQTYLAFARAGLEGEMMRRSDFHYSEDAFGIASYSKPATVLATLRELLGEDTFLRAYRTFIEAWAYKHPYPYDLFHVFEDVSGRNLDWFWKSWYFETWTLDQAVADVQVQDGQGALVVENRGRVPMPVAATITYADGTTEELTLPVDMWLEGRDTAILRFTPRDRITRVEIDPEHRFPDIDRSNNVWAP